MYVLDIKLSNVLLVEFCAQYTHYIRMTQTNSESYRDAFLYDKSPKRSVVAYIDTMNSSEFSPD